MKPSILLSASCLSVLVLSGCASHGYSRYDADNFVTEFYAWVDNIEPVTFDSEVGENVLIGATHGAISGYSYDSSDTLRGAIFGGFIAGLITAIVEGDNQGYEYHLSAVDGDSVIVLSDSYPAELGDCVRVRVTNNVHMLPVQSEQCAE
jgi:outer membrane lipoprotein SlyB